ncbi:hypothetical protein EG329_012745 [Mollisiaceae sp. DMI_Dod_QoI]|nr:hypothetical protein EG329_012745 [Helotiales sp. DMI_Dod_QoI]
MKTTRLFIIAALSTHVRMWNIPRDKDNVIRANLPQQPLQDPQSPTNNVQPEESVGLETGYYDAIDTNGDMALWEKRPSYPEPRPGAPLEASVVKSQEPDQDEDRINPSGSATAGRPTEREADTLNVHQDSVAMSDAKKDVDTRHQAGDGAEIEGKESEETESDFSEKIQLFGTPPEISPEISEGGYVHEAL